MTIPEESVPSGESRHKPDRMRPVYRAVWHLGQIPLRIYFRWRAVNRERVPLHGPLLIASNHESFIDPAIVGGAIRREVHFLARDSALRAPVWGRLLRYFNAMPLNLEGASAGGVRAGLEVLEEGKVLVLFPEGTRTPDGTVKPFRSGLGLLAAKSGAPVLPVRMFGMYEAYGRHLRIPRPGRVTVKVGRPLTFEKHLAEVPHASKQRLKEIYQKIADEVREAMLRLRPDEEA